jgi:hypothetical protein
VSTDKAVTPEVAETPSLERDRKAIRIETGRFARGLATRFPQAFIEAIGKHTKEEVLRLIRIALPPHPGRRRKASVTRAWELQQQGVAWCDIYPQCIPGYGGLRWKDRRKEQVRLQNAVHARPSSRPRQKRKISPVISNDEKNDRALFLAVAPATVKG